MPEKKSNLGRKPGTDDTLRSESSRLRFTVSEWNLLEEDLSKSGIKDMAVFLRTIVLRKREQIKFQAPVNKELRVEIARMGNNLNQIAHQLNMQIGSISIQEVTQKIGEIEETLREIKSKIEVR